MEPKLCLNGCGFYGSASTQNLCSKCHREEHINALLNNLSIKEETAAAAAAPLAAEAAEIAVVRMVGPKRCWTCKKRVKIARGFKCRCGFLFCDSHRYPEVHRCSFNYRAMGKFEIAKAYPMVKADKIARI